MSKLRLLDLFSGIAGFSVGLEKTQGFETVAFCELEPFCHRVLEKHFPHVPIYKDVRELTASRLAADGISVDFVSAGFPCQDASFANTSGEGTDGERTGLYKEAVRIARELDAGLFMENVPGLLSRGFGEVLRALAEVGFDAEWDCVPASYIGAWHRRERVWILAYPHSISGQQGKSAQPILRQSDLHEQSQRSFARWPGRSNLPKSRICGGNHGVRKRLHALGNSVVPQIPEMIGRAIIRSKVFA